MKKLTADDIVIKTAKEQLKKAIKEKFGTIKNFAEFIGKEPPRVSGYLGRQDLGSRSFRMRLINIFGKGVDELAKSPERQLSEYTDEIFDNIQIYNEKDDIIMIEKSINLCDKHKAFLARIKMERVRAMHYFFTKEQYLGKKHIRQAIKKAKKAGLDNFNIFFNCDYAMMFFHEKDYTTAKKIFRAIDIKRTDDDDFRNRALYKYYYAYGTLLSNMGKYKQARDKFECSLMYLSDDVLKGIAYNAMGLAYKREGKLDKALDYYQEAVKVQSNKIYLISMYNNIADLYVAKRNFEKALEHCEIALSLLDDIDIQPAFIVYQTYVEIKVIIGETEEVLESLVEWYNKAKNNFIDKGHIIRGLSTLIELSTKEMNFEVLKKVQIIIFDFLNQEINQDKQFRQGLTNCLGRISIIFHKNKII